MKRYVRSSISAEEYRQSLYIKEISDDPKEKNRAQKVIREYRKQQEELSKSIGIDEAIAQEYGFTQKTPEGDFSNGEIYIKIAPDGKCTLYSMDGKYLACISNFRLACMRANNGNY